MLVEVGEEGSGWKGSGWVLVFNEGISRNKAGWLGAGKVVAPGDRFKSRYLMEFGSRCK